MIPDDERLQKEFKSLHAAQDAINAEARHQKAVDDVSGKSFRTQLEIERALGGVAPATLLNMQADIEEQCKREALGRSLSTQAQIDAATVVIGPGDALPVVRAFEERQSSDHLAAMNKAIRNDKAALIALIRAEVKAEVTRQLDERGDNPGQPD